MPNLEKESQSDSAAVGETQEAQMLSRTDMAKLVGQRLESLRRAGLTHLPKGTGEYSFEPAEPIESQSQSRSSQPPRESQAESSVASNPPPLTDPPSNGVRESGSQFRPQQQQAAAEANSAALPDDAPVTPTPTSSSGLSLGEDSPATDSGQPNQPIGLETAYGPSLPLAERVSALKVLQEEVARCTRCDELASTRSQTVFGVGNPATRLVLLGEGPGADEDRVGEPFVGAAGQLLDKIISACKLSRSDVYILNAVKCRPPGNRNPSQSELANCWGYAEQQLEILQPEFICCLGSVAARTLLKTTLSIGKLRRQLHSYRGSRVLVTYHPAYLLRTPSAKKHVWEDMKFLMQEMGVDLSK